MILFFTSGTTGNPKMVRHTNSYPIAHYSTAFFVQDLNSNDIHWTISDTGWVLIFSEISFYFSSNNLDSFFIFLLRINNKY